MTRRIVFVTQELDPVVPGGAGAVVAGLADGLSLRHQVSVLLGAAAPLTTGVERYPVSLVDVGPGDGTATWFVERSRRLALALAEVCRGEAVDLVEFCDFEAVGYWSLAHRDELGLAAVRLAVRIHGPVEAVAAAVGSSPPLFDVLGRLERVTLAMADIVVVPSVGVGRWATDRYQLDPDRVVVAPPPVPEVARRSWTPTDHPSFAVYGRLAEQKGVHDLARALPGVLDAVPSATISFIGPDGWSLAENRPMSAVVTDLIPARYRHRVELVGSMSRERALDRLASVWAVVIPSRFETFCLAAHEVRRAGFPVIVPALPAFEPFRTGVGFLTYDGSVAELSAVLTAVATDRGTAERLAAEPAPSVGDSVAAYEGALPDPRHPRSQAGLATVAVQEADAALRPSVPRGTGMARRLLRILPDPLARLSVRLVPRRFKDRFRRVASWPAEQERRGRSARLIDLTRRVRNGEFPDSPHPAVTVVIPCFEQGQWIEDAIHSVFAQTFDSWEIVVVDDGSADPETVRILDDLGTWSRITLVRQKNRGLAVARNAGFARARGEFVVPLDADDELVPAYLDEMVAALSPHPEAAFAHCWARLFGDVDAIWVPRPFNRYWQRLSNGVVGCVLLRKAAWAAVGGYDETMRRGHEDWELWLRLDTAGWGQVRVNQVLFRYRKHGISMSVRSEAGFEAGLAEIRARRPDLYIRAALEDLKHEWYPLVSLIVDGGTRMSAPMPCDGAAVPDARSATGKYVADVRGRTCDPDAIVRLAGDLEQAPERAAMVGADGLVVWRRWALMDPGADLDGVLGADRVPHGQLAAGCLADPDWMIDPVLIPAGVRVMRQRPEEAGSLPSWVVG